MLDRPWQKNRQYLSHHVWLYVNYRTWNKKASWSLTRVLTCCSDTEPNLHSSCSSLSTRRLEHGCRYFLPSSHKRPGEVRHCCCWVMRFGSLSALRFIPKVLDRVEVRSSVPAKLWTPLLYGPDLTDLLEPHHHCINACNFMHFYPAVPFNLK